MLVNFYQTTRRYNQEKQPSSSSPPWEPQILLREIGCEIVERIHLAQDK
jgi:hypothetical protein